MSKFKVIYYWSDGTSDEEDEYFDSYEEAYDAGSYGLQCVAEGEEILYMSNPGDYPLDKNGSGNDYFEVEEI